MEEKMIPYIAFESATSRQERTIRRVWILCIILIIALIGTNAGWIYFESQWQVVETTTVTQDLDASDGGDAVINDGVHINGNGDAEGSD